MTTAATRVFRAFNSALRWNAFFYIAYKICFVSLTFVLYKRLPSAYFTEWAAINSFIFLLLLWLDGGLKKSIPRFAPLFSKNTDFHKKFIVVLLVIKVSLLLLAAPVLWYGLSTYIPDLTFLPLIIALFVTEGFCSLLLLVYHAHFWQKQFNLIQAFFLLIEMVVNCFFLLTFHAQPLTIVSFLFSTKIIANVCTILLSLALLPSLYTNTMVVSYEPLPAKLLIRDFIKHSLFMWGINLSESLSERNFLFPFITFVEGALVANLFKVVHDAAIFFQRIGVKTIGIADTALLSYIEVIDPRLSQIKKACTALFKITYTLCIPLVCLGFVFFFKNKTSLPSPMIIIFLCVASATSLEIVFSPYVRILEVKRQYKELFLSYTPYFFGYAILMPIYFFGYVSLLDFIVSIHSLRLSGLCLMTYFAHKNFSLSFPFIFIIKIFFLSLFLSLGAWFIL